MLTLDLTFSPKMKWLRGHSGVLLNGGEDELKNRGGASS